MPHGLGPVKGMSLDRTEAVCNGAGEPPPGGD